MIDSVRGKLTFWYVFTVSLLVIFFSFILYITIRGSLERSIDIALFTEGKIIRNTLLRSHVEEWDKIINERKKDNLPSAVKYIRIIDILNSGTTNVVIAKTPSLNHQHFPLESRAVSAALNSKFHFETYKNNKDFEFPVRILTMVIPTEKIIPVKVKLGPAFDVTLTQKIIIPYILQIGIPAKGMTTLIQKIRFNILIAVPILIIIISLIGFQVIKRAFTPIREIVHTSQKITAQDLSLRIPDIQSHDEVGELASTLNNMIERLETSFHQINRFSSDVSHELKSPITILRGELQWLLRQTRSPEEYQKTAQILLDETRSLENIINNLLLLSRLDQGTLKNRFHPIALDEILLESFEKQLPIATLSKVELQLEKIEPAQIMGDPDLLTHVFSNLIQNAIKYNDPGGKVWMSLIKTENEVEIFIKDTGIGIPEESIPYLFDRFYRVDKARSRESGGSGLGLSLVKTITELHEGSISVKSSLNNGSEFRLKFALCKEDKK